MLKIKSLVASQPCINLQRKKYYSCSNWRGLMIYRGNNNQHHRHFTWFSLRSSVWKIKVGQAFCSMGTSVVVLMSVAVQRSAFHGKFQQMGSRPWRNFSKLSQERMHGFISAILKMTHNQSNGYQEVGCCSPSRSKTVKSRGHGNRFWWAQGILLVDFPQGQTMITLFLKENVLRMLDKA